LTKDQEKGLEKYIINIRDTIKDQDFNRGWPMWYLKKPTPSAAPTKLKTIASSPLFFSSNY
jgi:hypothetical protein